MNIFIDNKSTAPIYEQIYSQIKNQIINDELKEDEPLPSIRNLAKDLRISVITTKRAYDELEKDGSCHDSYHIDYLRGHMKKCQKSLMKMA